MRQWANEIEKWFPTCQVNILHSSNMDKKSKNQLIKKMSENTT